MKIGSHVSMADGLLGAGIEAHSYNANTFMIYTGAPQNTKRKPLDQLKIEEGKAYMLEHGISDIVVHAPYIINLASYKPNIYTLAKDLLKIELQRTDALGSDYIVLHAGAFTDKDLDYGIQRIVDGLNEVLDDSTKSMILLETMTGKGSEIGSTFESLQRIIDGVNLKERIGICFDTCHIHDSGYDIVNNFDSVMQEFDDIIGTEKIKVLHINGSLNKCGAKKDRHANIGASPDNPKGFDHIGFDAIYNIVHSDVMSGKIFILETPWLDANTNLYKEEIRLLRETRSYRNG